jgi:hypothetical protein
MPAPLLLVVDLEYDSTSGRGCVYLRVGQRIKEIYTHLFGTSIHNLLRYSSVHSAPSPPVPMSSDLPLAAICTTPSWFGIPGSDDRRGEIFACCAGAAIRLLVHTYCREFSGLRRLDLVRVEAFEGQLEAEA